LQEEEENVMELDPTQFLAQGGSSDEENSDDENQVANNANNGPPHLLASLGLTHINSMQNPFASYAVSYPLNRKKKTKFYNDDPKLRNFIYNKYLFVVVEFR
jgi:hypothetical protein